MKRSSRTSILKKPVWWISMLVPLALILAACAPAAAPTTASVATAAPAATSAPAAVPVTGGEAVLNVATDARLGKILVGANGRTLYGFTKDGPNQSNCTAACLKNWPALTTAGSPQLGAGIDAALVGSAALADGSKVVTYNKMPLYYFYKDTKAGDANGQGVGSVWFTVSPDGKLVGQEAASGTPAGGENENATPAAAAEATINVAADPNLGKILVDGAGRTLYVFTKDAPDKSNCSGGCLKAWPALLTQGHPTLGPGVDASLVGSAALADGSKIVTYNHMPLYYFVQDAKPGDVKGQNNGSVWFVVSPDGKAVGQ